VNVNANPNPTRRRGTSPEKRRPTARPAPRTPLQIERLQGCLVSLVTLGLVLSALALLSYVLLRMPSPTNILILGIDRRPGQGDATRTDTILLLHADPGPPRMVLLSIPRDLWVTIPGHGEERVNTAHFYGELADPGSGPVLAAETVRQNFGVPVHRTLRLDFDAFRGVIDAAGGVDIDVPAPVIDDAYPTEDYGTMRIEIPAGMRHMDGETALRYARSRHGSSDFDRAARQQQILVALAKKLTSPGNWLLAPRVYNALQDAVETDLSFRDLVRLGLTWRRAGAENVEQIVIDQALTTPYRTANGAAVLLPRWDLIIPLVEAQLIH